MNTLNCYLACRDGRPWLIGGTRGGDQQTQWNVEVLTNILDHGMSIQEAVEAPRWSSFPGTDPDTIARPMVLRIEERVPKSARRELAARGHAIETLGPWDGGWRRRARPGRAERASAQRDGSFGRPGPGLLSFGTVPWEGRLRRSSRLVGPPLDAGERPGF